MMPARTRRKSGNRPQISEEDLEPLVPIVQAVKDAFVMTSWRIGDPADELAAFITLVVVARISGMLKEIGVYDRMELQREPDDNDLW